LFIEDEMNIAQGLETMTTRRLRALGAAALLLSSSGVVLAATVSFTPDPKDVMVGDSFTVDIVGSNFTELAGGTINLGFDSSLLTIDSVAVNSVLFDFLPDGGGPAAGNTWPNIGFDTFVNNPATGNFTIATITLTAGGSGTASLSILGSSQYFSATAQLSPTLVGSTVNISAVPLPAAAWLFGSGLPGLIGISRRKKAA
jgi:hypothetical protein